MPGTGLTLHNVQTIQKIEGLHNDVIEFKYEYSGPTGSLESGTFRGTYNEFYRKFDSVCQVQQTTPSPSPAKPPTKIEESPKPKVATTEIVTIETTTEIKEQLKTDILPNYLDTIDSATYNFKLYMISEKMHIDQTPFVPEQQIVIAETGATTIAIEDVEINTVPAYTTETQTGISRTFKFKLIQPLGASLLDKLYAASVKLGLSSYSKVPMILELRFKGRTELESLPMPNGDDQLLGNISWVWPIIITKMVLEVTKGGSVYNCDAVYFGDIAYTNKVADIDKAITILAKNVEEFGNKLEIELNKRELQKLVTGQTVPDVYKIQFADNIKKEKFVKSNIERNTGRSGSYKNINSNQVQIEFSPGTSIMEMVTSVLSSVELYQKNVIDSNNTEKVFKHLFKISTDVKLGPWDPGRGEYSKQYIYVIHDFKVASPVPVKVDNDGSITRIRYEQIKNLGVLRKRYDYLFTSLNDQVFDFDLKFNNAWYMALPVGSGLHNQTQLKEPGIKYDKKVKAVDKLQEELLKIIDKVSTAPSEPFDNNTQLKLQKLQREAQRLTEAASAKTIPTQSDLATINQGQNLNSSISNVIKSRETATISTSSQITQTFLEDITEEEISNAINLRIPITTNETSATTTLPTGVQGTVSENKTFFNTLFSQAMKDKVADLVNITLNIKGDPYWLEPAPVINTERTQPYTNLFNYRGEGSAINIIDLINEDNPGMLSETFFIFMTQFPNEADDETGLATFNKTPIINGVYRAVNVVNEFSKGKFTQKLYGVRETIIDLAKLDISIPNQDITTDVDTNTNTVQKRIPIVTPSVQTPSTTPSATNETAGKPSSGFGPPRG